jgi:excisionase family DNA binding protein
MTAQEVAEFLRISEAVVRQYAIRGRIPGRQIGDDWRFWRSAIVEWLRGPSGKEILLSQFGALEDDIDDMRAVNQAIYADRGRPEVGEAP